MTKDNNHSILTVLMLTIASLIISCLLTACGSDFMRYEVYHVDGRPCYVKDWSTGEKLPVTKELLEKATGEWTPCDPSLCE